MATTSYWLKADRMADAAASGVGSAPTGLASCGVCDQLVAGIAAMSGSRTRPHTRISRRTQQPQRRAHAPSPVRLSVRSAPPRTAGRRPGGFAGVPTSSARRSAPLYPRSGVAFKRAMRRNMPATRCQQRASIQMINQIVIDLIAAPASRSQTTNSPP